MKLVIISYIYIYYIQHFCLMHRCVCVYVRECVRVCEEVNLFDKVNT